MDESAKLTYTDLASMRLADIIDEEVFFFMNHMQIPESETLSMVVYRRKSMIQRFIEQKRREHAELEKAARKK